MQDCPKAIGPYSAYRVVGGFLYTSGQIPLNPQSGEVVGGGIKEQTQRTLKNVEAILKENGLDFGSVVKTAVFLADMNDFSGMNEIYVKFFSTPYPARSAIAVKGLPKGVLVEIEIVAYKGGK